MEAHSTQPPVRVTVLMNTVGIPVEFEVSGKICNPQGYNPSFLS